MRVTVLGTGDIVVSGTMFLDFMDFINQVKLKKLKVDIFMNKKISDSDKSNEKNKRAWFYTRQISVANLDQVFRKPEHLS